MEGLSSPRAAMWLPVAGGEGSARHCKPNRVLQVRTPSVGAQRGATLSSVLIWRRATALVLAFPQRSSPFSASPAAEKEGLEKVKIEEDVPLVQNQTGITEASDESEKAAAGEGKAPNEGEPKNVRVSFTLQKSCEFGEQFLLVGENHVLGSWDPDKAMPLEWSEGHVWGAQDVELPVEEEIKYKFILRTLSGEIKWQPGPDRVLQTYDSVDPIVVEGEWSSTYDEEEITEKQEATEDSTEAGEEEITEKQETTEASTEAGEEKITEKQETTEDSTEAGADGDGATGSNQTEVTDGNVKNLVVADEEKPAAGKGDPVLIPGLDSLPTEAEGKSTVGEITSGKTDGAPVAAEVNLW